MKRHDSPLPAPEALLLVALLSASATALSCGPKAAATDATTASTGTTAPDTTTSSSSSNTSTTDHASTPATTNASTTSSTTCNTSDCSGSSSTGGCGFLGCPTDLPAPGSCDVFAQDCPEGPKCAAWADDGGNSWNAVHCVDVTGDGQPGDPCVYDGIAVGSDDCAKGSMCWYFDENDVGFCVQHCTGNAEAPMCPKGPCWGRGEGVLSLCLPTCDPLLQDCPGTTLCIPDGDNFFCGLDVSGEEGQANDPCEFANVCDPGLVCLDPAAGGAGCDQATGGCCSPFCEFPDGACPNPDQGCVQWFDPMQLPPDDPELDIGVCAVPQ